MKKTIVISLSVIAILLLGTSLAMAYESPEEYAPPAAQQEVQGPNFIDGDGDGICDRASEGLAGTGRAGTGQGFGPNGLQNGTCGENFVDEDGDGICDLASERLASEGLGRQGRMGQGLGLGQGQGQGRGRNAQGVGSGS